MGETQNEDAQRMMEIDAKIKEHWRAIITLKSERNTVAPVSRLPPEVLALCFLQLAEGSPRSWFLVMRTCKRWREIALQTPELWSHVNPLYKRELLEACVKRSGVVGLKVNLSYFRASDKASTNYRFLLKHWSRFQTLAASGIRCSNTEWQSIHNSIEGEALRVKRIDLASEPHSPPAALDCSQLINAAPSLRYLFLKDCSFSWSSSSPKDLTELSLQFDRAHSGKPSLIELLNVLVRSPRLERLDLAGLGTFDVPMGTFQNEKDKVRLLYLQSLKISRIKAMTCERLLGYIEFPQGLKWQIDCFAYPIWDPMSIFPKITSRAMSFSHLTLQLFESKVSFHGYIPESLLQIMKRIEDLEGIHPVIRSDASLVVSWKPQHKRRDYHPNVLSSLAILIDCGAWTDVLDIFIVLRVSDTIPIDKRQWLDLLEPLVNLEKLSVMFYPNCDVNDDNWDDDTDITVDTELALIEALMHSTAPNEITCPRLHELELRSARFYNADGDSIVDNLSECLEYRESKLFFTLDKLTIQDGDGIGLDDINELKQYVEEIDCDGEKFYEYPEDTYCLELEESDSDVDTNNESEVSDTAYNEHLT